MSAPHRIIARRGLPNGRAVLGALLVTVAAVGTFAIANTGVDRPTTEYLVVVDEIEPGEAIELDDVALEVIHLSPAIAANALQSTRGLDGATALRHLLAGTVLDARDLNGAAFVDGEAVTGVHELTIPVPADRSPSVVRRGDRVTVLAYSSVDGILHTAIEDALVLAFETEPVGIGSSGEARLTLAVPDADDVAEVALWSYQALTVVLTTRDIDDVYPRRLAPPTSSLPPSLAEEAT